MLSWLRKQTKTTWVKWMLYGLAVTFFGGFGVLSSTKIQSCLGGEQMKIPPLVTVGEKQILKDEYYNRLSREWNNYLYQLQQQFQGQVPEELMDQKQFRKRVMEDMIERSLLQQQAEKLNIVVADQEIRTAITDTGMFRSQTSLFDKQNYMDFLKKQGLKEQEFELQIRQSLAINKIRKMIMDSVQVLDGEAREHYQINWEKVNLEYMALDPEQFAADATPTDEEVKDYYESNPDQFDWAEARQLEYVYLSFELFADQVKPDKDEIAQFYEDSKARYLISPEQVWFSDIMIKYPQMASEEEIEAARLKIAGIRDKAMAPDGDFAALAMEFSEDLGTRDNGGKMEEPVKRGELIASMEDAAFSLELNEISEPINANNAWFLITVDKREDAVYETLENLQDKLRESLVHIRAMDMAHEQALAVKARAEGTETLVAIAEADEKINLLTSAWFQKDSRIIPGILDPRLLAEEGFYLEEGEISKPLEGLDGIYIIKLKGILEPHPATIEEAGPIIFENLIPEIKVKRTKQIAREHLDKLKQGESMTAVAKQIDVELEQTGLTGRANVYMEELGFSEELEDAVFAFKMDTPWPEDLVEVGGKVLILHLLEVEPADMDKFEENKSSVITKLTGKRRQDVFDEWMRNLKDQQVTYLDEWKQTQ